MSNWKTDFEVKFSLEFKHFNGRKEIKNNTLIVEAKSEDEAIEMANLTQYGLAGSVWTSNPARGKSVAERIDSGILWVNTWLHRDLRTPFGGVKNSGVGREGGDWSLNFFSELSNICVKDD